MAEPTNESAAAVSPTAEQIIERGRQRRIKAVAYCGGTVYTYGMTRAEAKAYRAACTEAAGSVAADEYRDERLLVHMIRDASGKRIFSESHLTQLADLNEADFAPLWNACAEVNGWSAAAEEEIRKNFGTRSPDSGSGSPPTSGSPVPTP
jgi:hypothetical protein